MADNVITTGLNDTSVFLQNAANLKAPFTVDTQSGQFPALGNIAVNRRLASQWQVIHLDERIFVDGMGITSMSAESEDAAGVRIPMLVPPVRNMRTLAITPCGSGVGAGTPGNDQAFNRNLPHGMQTNAVDIWFNQVYDEAAQISRDQAKMIGNNLDILGQFTATIPQVTAQLMDSEIMATQIASALSVLGNNGLYYNPDTDTNGYMQRIMNDLGTALSNVKNGYVEGVVSYPVEKSVYVLRYRAFNKLMSINNGAIINSDIGQKILLNGKFDDTGSRYLGGAIRGSYGGILIKVVPDAYWDVAAALLNLTVEQKAQFDKIDGYIANGIGTYFGRAAVVTDVDKSPTTSLGYIVRNDWRWGTVVTRRSSVQLLISSESNGGDFTNPITSFKGVIAPSDVEAVLSTYNGSTNSTVQRIEVKGETTTVTLTVTGTDSAKVTDATLAITSDNMPVGYTNNADGTYTFKLGRGRAATVVVSATGYASATVNITSANTASATYAVTQALTAAATKKGN